MSIPQQTKTKFYFYIVNGFTLASLFLGMVSIVFTTSDRLTLAACCLLASVLLDGCDGNLARKWSVSSPFGEKLDSLADMTAFGIAITFFAYGWILAKQPAWDVWIGLICSLIAITSAIRLARFNTTAYNDRYFEGVPTTAAAGIITLIYLSMPNLAPFWALGLVGGLSLLMVSHFAYPKLKPPRILVMVGGPLLLSMLVWNLEITILLAVIIYLASGPILSWRIRHISIHSSSVR